MYPDRRMGLVLNSAALSLYELLLVPYSAPGILVAQEGLRTPLDSMPPHVALFRWDVETYISEESGWSFRSVGNAGDKVEDDGKGCV